MTKLGEELDLADIKEQVLSLSKDELKRLQPLVSDLEVIVDHLKHLENYMPDQFEREHGFIYNIEREKDIARFKFKEIYDYLAKEISS